MLYTLTIAIRIFKKHLLTKLSSVITLSVGLIFFLIAVTVYIKDTQRNSKFKNSESVFRIDTRIQFNSGDVQELSVSPAAVGPYLEQHLSSVTHQCRLWPKPSLKINAISHEFFAEDVVMVDMTFFNIFQFTVEKGTLVNAHSRRDVAVLSSMEAFKLFGNSDPIGKVLSVDSTNYEVIAVITASDTDFDHAIYLGLNPDIYEFEWTETYVQFSGDNRTTDLTTDLNTALPEIMEGEYNEDVMKISFAPISLSEMRFQEKLFGTIKSNKSFLNFVITLAFALLALCCLSVLNLESTISLNRSKEIKMKKIFGASKLKLFSQSILENSIVFIISIPFAVLAFALVIPSVNIMWNYDLKFADLTNPISITIITCITIIFIALTAFISYLLHFSGNNDKDTNQTLRNPAFVGIKRFILPVQLFICTVIVLFASLSANQIHYTNEVDVKFEYQHVYVADIIGNDIESLNLEILINDLKLMANVLEVAQTNKNSVPGRQSDIQIFNLNSSESDKEIVAQHIFIDDHFFSVLGIPAITHVKQGEMVVNQKMSSAHNIIPTTENSLNSVPVVGVIENYYHDGVFGQVKPTVFEYDQTKFNTLLIRATDDKSFHSIQSALHQTIKKNHMNVSIHVNALPDIYFLKQAADKNILKLVRFCNYFVIIITMIGILSSTNMLLNLGKKENMIRRILGAFHFDLLKSTARKIYIESTLALLTATGVGHWIFFSWQEKYTIRSPFSFESYLGLGLVMIFSVTAFTLIFFAKINQARVSELSSS